MKLTWRDDNSLSLWDRLFIYYGSVWNAVQCVSHSYFRQSSLDAKLKQQSGRTEKVDIFWECGDLTTLWHQSNFQVFKETFLPLIISWLYYICSYEIKKVHPHTYAYKKSTCMWLNAHSGKQERGNMCKWSQWHKNRHMCSFQHETIPSVCSSHLGRLHNHPLWIMQCPPIINF